MSNMKILAATLLISLNAIIYAKAETGRFDFYSQVGVVDARSDVELCLIIPNGNIVEGSRVQIISPYKPQSAEVAIVQRKLSSSCSRNPAPGPNDSFYSLRLTKGRVAPETVSIGVVNVQNSVLTAGGVASVDLNGDGRKEYFRVCTSQEGLHLTVWSGRPLRGVRKWHWYYYLGYDVKPSCTKEEVR